MTRLLLEFCRRRDATLHAIDPRPRFDETTWPGAEDHLIVHRSRSLDVLPGLPGVDVVLIDGDHNWYTVHHELVAIEERADHLGRPFPVVLLHDVGWPYGRRDLYYDPGSIPPEHRHPHARRGIHPSSRELVSSGGINPWLDNALYEGGPRNGVLTAVEDFLHGRDHLAWLHVPGFHDLGILLPREVPERSPRIAALLSQWRLPGPVANHVRRLEGARVRLGMEVQARAAAPSRPRHEATKPNGREDRPLHVLYVHPNFPAQFGHLASRLAQKGHRATFVSRNVDGGRIAGIDTIRYHLRGGATKQTHYCSRTFENSVWHASAVYDALAPRARTLAPDLIVGHSGFGTTLFLHELFPETPVVNYFEYFYHSRDSDLDFRPDQPVADEDRLRSRARNAMILLDLEYCAAGYTPTQYQASLLPAAYHDKLQVIHDGIDTSFWRRREVPESPVASIDLVPGMKVVTYVSRGLESMRGFDVFMKIAKGVCAARRDVVFLVIGEDRVAYGGDLRHTSGKTFKDEVLDQDDYDLDRIHFLGRVPPRELVRIFSRSDLHIYLTVPFVLSWSLLNAMACGCTVLASDTAPVREVIEHGRNGLVGDFFDVEGLTKTALEVLERPGDQEELGRAAEETVRRDYALDVVLPRMESLYWEVLGSRTSQEHR